MRYVAVDPGKMTGVAYWDPPNVPDTEERTPEEFYGLCIHSLAQWPRCVIICERYIITPATLKKTQQPWSLEMIGVVKATCFIGGHELVMQSASEAKSMVSNDVLRRIGWWHVGGEGHANDALRHLARYALLNDLIDRRLLLSS